ncbi:hypothetical protein M0R45_014624 [Rubus argutus]|uniref:CCHC-type domain-containing protein n=1 Tax=Rubus argutus TaxID=59490 RepID=A0AAW1XM52_RUBAR
MDVRSSSESSESNSSGDSLTQTVEDSLGYCTICDDNVNHSTWECPDRSKGFGLCCSVCLGPCKNNDEHRECQVEMIKYCVVCGAQARHWGEDCPHVPEDDEVEVDLSTLTDDYYGF